MTSDLEQAETEKLKLEARILARQLSRTGRTLEWMRATAGLAGILTGLVALVGLWLSVNSFQAEQQQEREARAAQELRRSQDLLLHESPARRLAGVSNLSTYLRSEDYDERRTAFVELVRQLDVESEREVREFIVFTLQSDAISTIRPDDINYALNQLVLRNASLLTAATAQPNRSNSGLSDLERSALASRLESIGSVIAQLARYPNEGFTDFSGIYCRSCDFSNANLTGANFADSVLDQAIFDEAQLERSSFKNSLLNSTSFIRADLTRADLTIEEVDFFGSTRSLRSLTPRNQIFDFIGPIFNCANLSQADFSNRAVFEIVYSEDPFVVEISNSAQFVGADLTDAKFVDAHVVGREHDNHGSPFQQGNLSSSSLGQSDMWDFRARLIIEEDDVEIHSGYRATLNEMLQSLSGSNWPEANFSGSFERFLNRSPPGHRMDFGFENEACEPVSQRRGFNPELSIRYRETIDMADVQSAVQSGNISEVFEFLGWGLDRNSRIRRNEAFNQMLDTLFIAGSLHSQSLESFDDPLLATLFIAHQVGSHQTQEALLKIGAQDTAANLAAFPVDSLTSEDSSASFVFEEFRTEAVTALDEQLPDWRSKGTLLIESMEEIDPSLATYLEANTQLILAAFEVEESTDTTSEP